MRFLLDAQLPLRLVRLFKEHGHAAEHVSGLPEGNRSSDRDVADHADRHGLILVSKDRDFRDAHLLRHRPQRLRVIAIGNCRNAELIAVLTKALESLESAFEESDFVEVTQATVVVHGRHT